MDFPEFERVKYGKMPLIETVCQLRFPPILKIDSEVPAIFQEKIRNIFPNYEETMEIQAQLNIAGLNNNNEISNPLSQSTTKNHVFISDDGGRRVNLTRSFITLTVNNYDTWEDFSECLSFVLDAFEKEYHPGYYSRIGLRYIDVFVRTNLGLPIGEKWSSLIKTPFLGLLSDQLEDKIISFQNIAEINLGENCKSTIKALLVKNDADPTNEECFMLDSDLFRIDKIKLGDKNNILEFLHKRSTSIIRMAITDKLHNQMEPRKL